MPITLRVSLTFLVLLALCATPAVAQCVDDTLGARLDTGAIRLGELRRLYTERWRRSDSSDRRVEGTAEAARGWRHCATCRDFDCAEVWIDADSVVRALELNGPYGSRETWCALFRGFERVGNAWSSDIVRWLRDIRRQGDRGVKRKAKRWEKRFDRYDVVVTATWLAGYAFLRFQVRETAGG